MLAFGLAGSASTAGNLRRRGAQGSIVVDSNVKNVQHPTGGALGDVRVYAGNPPDSARPNSWVLAVAMADESKRLRRRCHVLLPFSRTGGGEERRHRA